MTEIPLKIRLILRKTSIFDYLIRLFPCGKGQVNNAGLKVSRKFYLWTLSRFIFTSLFLPFFSHAASFSDISLSSIIGINFALGAETIREISDVDFEYNSQNIDILIPEADNNQTVGSIGGGKVTVVDEVALVPEIGSVGTTLDIDQTQNGGKISVYEVREGDTLSQIAEMFDISANTIRWANDIDGSIRPGQVLIILPVTGVTHKVKNGGTIADVAKIYGADVREIALFNGIDEEAQLKPGDEVIVPNVDPVVKSSGKKTTKLTQPYVASYSGPAATAGYYQNPVPGATMTQNLHGYNAVDLGAPVGTPVYASADGRIIDSRYGGWNGGYAIMIIISHDNGTQTLYAHLSQNLVKVGQKVEQGEVIGYVGSTGNSTGPHLHFEVRGAKNPLAACRVGSTCSI
ncbi:MAG TPA: peptidoglycan DD-metalloendopeptidase family protein [Candidatus Paceibacterota bacterium]|nr:peptidoglycan DD-metalloendopeptidase family protein [Candidatus Paceibacterota bacterium]HRZ34247.1 peptidoglycan DD-metalloendopeptidase family protein [Candidatus Paceibacterota bacterium]